MSTEIPRYMSDEDISALVFDGRTVPGATITRERLNILYDLVGTEIHDFCHRAYDIPFTDGDQVKLARKISLRLFKECHKEDECHLTRQEKRKLQARRMASVPAALQQNTMERRLPGRGYRY